MIPYIEHAGRTYTNFTVADLLASGVPQSAIDAAALERSVANVKAECRRRIYAVASAEAQMNMTAAAAVISAKSTSARTDAERATLAAFAQSLDWVAAMRAAVETLAGDPSAAFDDDGWPAPPQAVVDLAAQY